MDSAEQPSTAPAQASSEIRPPCPILPGWTVSVQRVSGAYGTADWKGVRIGAKHQCGHGFHFGIRDKCDPALIDTSLSEVTLLNGEVVSFLPEEPVELKYDEARWLSVLWRGCVSHIREWEAKYCGEGYSCLCHLSAKDDDADNPCSAS